MQGQVTLGSRAVAGGAILTVIARTDLGIGFHRDGRDLAAKVGYIGRGVIHGLVIRQGCGNSGHLPGTFTRIAAAASPLLEFLQLGDDIDGGEVGQARRVEAPVSLALGAMASRTGHIQLTAPRRIVLRTYCGYRRQQQQGQENPGQSHDHSSIVPAGRTATKPGSNRVW